MKKIKLAKNYTAAVSDEDFEILNRYQWFLHKQRGRFYAYRREVTAKGRRKYIYMHRQILGVVDSPDQDCDHINGDGLDNRRENLRLASRAENCRAFRKKSKGKSSKYRGVSWWVHANAWIAQIIINYRRIHLGYFKTEEDAAKAYDSASKKHFKDFAKPNFK